MVVATVTCNNVSIGIFTIPGNHSSTGIRAKQFLLLVGEISISVGGGNIHQCWWWEGVCRPPVRFVLSKPATYPDLTSLL
jgi:hypothetical protein